MWGLLLRESLGEFDQIGDRMKAAGEPLGAKYRVRTGGGQWIFPEYEFKRGRWVKILGSAMLSDSSAISPVTTI